MEKPVAVDRPGIRRVIAAARLAKERKGLGIVAGTQRRHQAAYLETMKRIHDGAIGEIVAGQCYWNQGGLWMHPRAGRAGATWSGSCATGSTSPGSRATTSSSSTSTTSTSMNWAMRAHPLECHRPGRPPGAHRPGLRPHLRPLRGRVRVPGRRAGAELVPADRQRRRPRRRARWSAPRAPPTPRSWIDGQEALATGEGEARNPYEQEHVDLIASIRAGEPLNEGEQRGREHADRDHGPHVDLHRPGRSPGSRPWARRRTSRRRATPSARCRCRR